MTYKKFILKEDIINQITKEVKLAKGTIFDSVDGTYQILPDLNLNTEEIINNELFDEYIDIITTEVPNEDDVIRNWRIQLDIKTKKSNLKIIEDKIREIINNL
ncbi:MAG: hypothetical protein M0R46_06605 [Candidatus Muirbacterium halophilum]|nr:hypothetical protein [Candidatus Muirbacterium halophilum]